MRVGVAGPASLHYLRPLLNDAEGLPRGYEFPQTSLIIEELVETGHEVCLFTLDSTTTRPQMFKGHNLTVHVGRYRRRHRARDFFAVERADLMNAMEKERCDVIHAHWTYEFALAALESGTPCLVTLRDWAPTILRLKRDPYRFVRLLMHRRALHRGRHFTVTSPYLQQKLLGTTGRSAPLIPNGLSSSLFIQEQRELRSDHRVLVSVNNGFGRLKNVGALLEAFARARGSMDSAELWLIGVGYEQGGAAQAWATDRGLDGGVKFMGRLDYVDTVKRIGMADLLVHPSLEESFGMTLVEAMAQGTPVVAGARSGAVPWVLNHGEAGILVNVESPDEIAASALRILGQPGLWRSMSSKGLGRARSEFALRRIVEKYIVEYEAISQTAA